MAPCTSFTFAKVTLYTHGCLQVSAPVVPSTTQEKPKDSDQFEWVTIEQSGELVYEAPESIAAEPPPINKQQSQSSSSPSSSVQTMSPIPAHSLAAFGLFLRLPGYAEVLLKERKHAQCLLRLVLGVTDDGEGSKLGIFISADCIRCVNQKMVVSL